MNSETTHPSRVLITKIGLDGHDRGSRLVAAFLRDAGFEVIYTPPWQSIDAVVDLALQEDVDVIGISSLSTDHLIVPDLMRALTVTGLGHIRVVVGGIVPVDEHALPSNACRRAVFWPGLSSATICAQVTTIANGARNESAATIEETH